jgi:hypothetical protein
MSWTSLYLANKMAGVPYFNAPWFDMAAKELRKLKHVGRVFNPAEHDREMGFEPMLCPNGSPEEARAARFQLEDALRYDWNWIVDMSDGLIIGPQWQTSKGTISEIACHQALGLPVWEYECYLAWHQGRDPLHFLEDLVLPPLLETRKMGGDLLNDDGLTCDCR